MVTLSHRRPRLTVAATNPTESGWLAYAACATAHHAGRAPRVIQVIAWPTLPSSWHQLGMQWAAQRGLHTATPAPVQGRPVSWMTTAAPTLTSAFSESIALECSLANLMGRAAIELAIDVVEVGSLSALPTESSAASKAFIDALTQFSVAQSSARRTRCRRMVVRAPHSTEILEQAWSRTPKHAMRPALDDLVFDRNLARESTLPLDYCQLVAEASLRLLEDREAVSPLFDAIEGKALRLPPCLLRRPRKKPR